jgi:tetratricopeptide (TPR) repeat protein
MLGEIHGRAERIDEAERAYRKAIAARDHWEVPYANLGNLLLSVDRGEDAVAVYREGLSKLPDNDRLQFSLAAAQERAGDGQGAIATYEAILERRPGSEIAANNYAALVADFQFDDPAKIDRALQHAKHLETSDNAFYLDTLGWLYYRKGDYEQARIYLDRAVALRADIPAILYHLGMTLYKLGDNTGARAELEKALANEAAFPGRDEAERTLRDLHQG